MLAMRISLILLLVALLAGCNQKPEITAQNRPNLLFIIPDQFRTHALGFMKQDPVQTPNLDRLAEESMVFVNAISNRPLCSPYRAMLMTGKYPFKTGVLTNCNTSSRKYGNYLRSTETTITDVLSENGYNCGYIGKWHLDAPAGPDVDDWRKSIWDAYTPPEARHGIDFWYSYGTFDQHFNPHYWINDASREDTTFINEWSPRHEVEVAREFINNQTGDQPWVLFLSMNPPHPPYQLVPDEYLSDYEGKSAAELLNRQNVPETAEAAYKHVKNYFAAVTGVDDQIGQLMEFLEEKKLNENTIVVFTSDHGELMGSHGLMQKGPWYEESVRIPFMIRWPEKITPAIDSLHLAVPDVMPTLLGLIDLEDQIPADVQGINYQNLLLGDGKIARPDFNLYLNPRPESALGGFRGFRSNQYTFVLERNNEGKVVDEILYDNLNDPYQLKNVAASNPDLVNRFSKQLMKRLTEIDDFWVEYDRSL